QRGDQRAIDAITEVSADLEGRPHRRRSNSDRQSRSEVSARHRQRQLARSEIAFNVATRSDGLPIPLPLRVQDASRPHVVHEHLMGDAEHQLTRRALPDVDFLRELEREAEQAYQASRPDAGRILDLVAFGFARFEESPDPGTEAAAL